MGICFTRGEGSYNEGRYNEFQESFTSSVSKGCIFENYDPPEGPWSRKKGFKFQTNLFFEDTDPPQGPRSQRRAFNLNAFVENSDHPEGAWSREKSF